MCVDVHQMRNFFPDFWASKSPRKEKRKKKNTRNHVFSIYKRDIVKDRRLKLEGNLFSNRTLQFDAWEVQIGFYLIRLDKN